MAPSNHSDGFIIEFIKMGNYVKVSAVCTKTGVETSIVGDPKASKKELEDLAVKKLLYVLRKRMDEHAGKADDTGAETAQNGIIV